MAIALPGCSNYVKRDEFNSTITELRATDQRLQSQIEALSQKYDALVVEVNGRVRVETGAHFATGDATLSEQVRPGEIGDAGRDNRRVSLVIDYAGASAPPPM